MQLLKPFFLVFSNALARVDYGLDSKDTSHSFESIHKQSRPRFKIKIVLFLESYLCLNHKEIW